MRGYATGLGIAAGAAVGIFLGFFIFESWWAPLVGVSIGLLVGAIIDMQTTRRDSEGR